MLLIRRFEEKAGEAYSLGKIGGFCHLYIGQEAVAVGSIAALRARRLHHRVLSRAWPRAGARHRARGPSMAELFGKATGCSHGKGGSMHLFDASLGFLGGHGIVGGHIPLAAGMAFAIKYRKTDQVAVCYFGEAAVNIGAFHEALNMAALWKLPAIFIVENNRYGMGTALERASASLDLSAARRTPTTWPTRWWTARTSSRCATAMDARGRRAPASDKHPTLLEIRTYRYMGHSMSDPVHGTYRTKEEVEEYRQRDPIVAAAGERLRADGAASTRRGSRRWTRRCIAEVEDAVPVRRGLARSRARRAVDRRVCARGALRWPSSPIAMR